MFFVLSRPFGPSNRPPLAWFAKRGLGFSAGFLHVAQGERCGVCGLPRPGTATRPVLHRTHAILPFEGRAEVAWVFVAQFGADVADRQEGVEQVMCGHVHAIVEEKLEHGGAKLLLEHPFQRTLVGAHQRGQVVERWHVVVLGEDNVLGVVYLVAHEQTVVAACRRQAAGIEKAREAIDDFRFQVAVGAVAHQSGAVNVVGRPYYGLLHGSVLAQQHMGVVAA